MNIPPALQLTGLLASAVFLVGCATDSATPVPSFQLVVVMTPIQRIYQFDEEASALRKQGNYTGAVAAYEAALKLEEDLLRQSPGNLDKINDTASSYYNLGEVLGLMGRYGEAAEVLSKSKELRAALRVLEPENNQYLFRFANAAYFLGQVYSSLRDDARALSELEEALSVFSTPKGKEPDNGEWNEKQGLVWREIGRVRRNQNRIPEAKTAFATACEIFEVLGRRFPKDINHRHHLALVLGEQYWIARWEDKDLERAKALLLRTLEIERFLLAKDPGDNVYRKNLGISLNQFAGLAEKMSDFALADSASEEAVVLIRQVAAMDGGNTRAKDSLCDYLENRVSLLVFELKQADRALPLAIEWRTCSRELAAACKDEHSFRESYAYSVFFLGDIYGMRGEIELSRPLIQEAFELQRALVKEHPTHSLCQSRFKLFRNRKRFVSDQIASELFRKKQYADYIAQKGKALAFMKAILDDQHIEKTRMDYDKTVHYALICGELDYAQQLVQRAQAENLLSPGLQVNHFHLLALQAKNAEAKELLEKHAKEIVSEETKATVLDAVLADMGGLSTIGLRYSLMEEKDALRSLGGVKAVAPKKE